MKAIGLDRRMRERVGLHHITMANAIMRVTGRVVVAVLSTITTPTTIETATSKIMTDRAIMITVGMIDKRADSLQKGTLRSATKSSTRARSSRRS